MKNIDGLWVLIAITLLASCGPSPEAVATMTASAWTPTPEPTPTATPMPFDLEVSLAGEGGEPVHFAAYVSAPENKNVMPDENGKVEFLNLPGPEMEVSVTAQGYQPHTETISLERGMNQKTLTLALDPAQINPATACAPGQKVLYIEDFEDGFVGDWDGNPNRPMWDFVDEEGRGKVLTFNGIEEGGWGTIMDEEITYSNILWKMDLKGGDTHFQFHMNDEGQGYFVIFQPGREGIVLIHDETGAQRGYNEMEWTDAAISYFDGSLEFWINNELYIALDDPNPIPEGRIGFVTHSQGAPFSMDNLIICELTKPYAPPAAEEVVEE